MVELIIVCDVTLVYLWKNINRMYCNTSVNMSDIWERVPLYEIYIWRN